MENNLQYKEPIKTAIASHLETYSQQNGATLYSGISTLTEGRFYLMGFNPGEAPQEGKGHSSILDSVEDAFTKNPERYSAYRDLSWDGNKLTRHQETVQYIAKLLDKDIEDIFSANLIFIRSALAADVKKTASDFAKRCWPVHKLFLSIVRPKVIICLGNGDRLSSFSFLSEFLQKDRSAIEYVKDQNFRHGKFFNAKINFEDGDSLDCQVVGVPHPSRFSISQELAKKIEGLRS